MPTTLNIYVKRYLRYVEYLLRWLILEKPRGLDFSMRAKSAISIEGNRGYALTSRKAVENILRGLPIGKGDSFLDIGCGKGGVLWFGSAFPFGRVAGIEVEPHLVEIARRNMQVLHLEDRIEVIAANAVTFEHYGEFNFFFLFNPFDAEIYRAVLTQVFSCLAARGDADRTVWLLCYGDSNAAVIENSGCFELHRNETCPYRGNSVRIWKSKVGCHWGRASAAPGAALNGDSARSQAAGADVIADDSTVRPNSAGPGESALLTREGNQSHHHART